MLISAWANSEPASSQPNDRVSSRHGAGGPGVTSPSRWRSETSDADERREPEHHAVRTGGRDAGHDEHDR